MTLDTNTSNGSRFDVVTHCDVDGDGDVFTIKSGTFVAGPPDPSTLTVACGNGVVLTTTGQPPKWPQVQADCM